MVSTFVNESALSGAAAVGDALFTGNADLAVALFVIDAGAAGLSFKVADAESAPGLESKKAAFVTSGAVVFSAIGGATVSEFATELGFDMIWAGLGAITCSAERARKAASGGTFWGAIY